ncbi:MAG: hypothetical protein CL489_06540 [Acidobacteria bacterium]|nr:hypothetical protein [Acidobacteriota bacterium]
MTPAEDGGCPLMNDLYEEMKRRPKRKNQRFRIEMILDAMDQEDRESLSAALIDEDIQHVRVSEVLNEHGYEISVNAVRNYRSMLRQRG